ncbi:MAG: hypothetical protein IPL08_10385, partial [Saprospiraceae bacterium]|nr:hypothetical protein [Saprospiraceae bacterium]
PEVAQYGFWTMQILLCYGGLCLASITIWDDSLELALGVHATTNILGATLFTYRGSVLQTDSLFMINEGKTFMDDCWFYSFCGCILSNVQIQISMEKMAYCQKTSFKKMIRKA